MALPPRPIARARDRGGSWYRQRREWRATSKRLRGHVEGAREFRKLLDRLPQAMRDEIVEMLDETGTQVGAAARADSSSRRVTAAISKRLSPASLRLRVGLIGQSVNRQLWFSRIIEKGRKAQTVNVRRRRKAGGISTYQMRVRELAGRPFIYSTKTKLIRDSFGGRIGTFWDQVLRRASMGIDDG